MLSISASGDDYKAGLAYTESMRITKVVNTTIGCSALVVVGGCLSSVQIRINGELGHQLQSPLIAAFISFLGGAVCAWGIAVAMPGTRRALTKLRTLRRSGWLFTSGAYGALYVATTIVAGPIIGIAATSVAVVAGKVCGGLLIDQSRFFRYSPVTLRRLTGALLAIVAVIISQIGIPAKEWQPLLILLLCLSGMSLSLQAALQGSLNKRLDSLPLVTALSFSLGALLLLVALLGLYAGGALHFSGQANAWWLYSGGAFGVACVVIAAMAVPIIGVFRLVIATAVGQLVGSLLLDYFLPLGSGLRVPLVVAACVTIGALWITRRHRTPAESLPAR
jgi:bacterial/archaeal transporter family-2 protein